MRLAACTAAAALLQLDGTLITVALPTVAHGLHVKGSSTSVVLSAYFGAYALVLLPAGELVDRFGVRRLALCGLAVFAVGALAGALVTSFGELIVARIIQGAGAGLVSPAALAGAVSGFPPERRGSALGIWGASAGMSNLLGPLLGGLLTVAFGWRADWWALVPLSLAAAIGIARLVPAVVRTEPERGRSGMNRIVLAATLVAALTFAVMIGAFYIAEQYLQRVAGFSALGASGALVLVALLVGVAAPLAGRLVDRYGERVPALLGFHRRRDRPGGPGDPRFPTRHRGNDPAAHPGRPGPGHAVRPHQPGGAERHPAGLARTYVGAALGGQAGRRSRRRRARRDRALRDADRGYGSPRAAAGRRHVPGGGHPGGQRHQRRPQPGEIGAGGSLKLVRHYAERRSEATERTADGAAVAANRISATASGASHIGT